MQVSAVITNFETWQLTLRCVRQLRQLSGPCLAEIVVIDDASTSPMPPEVGDFATVIHNTQNRGYVASANIGVRQARGDVVILLDSDALPLTDPVAVVVERFSRDAKLAALGYCTVDERGHATGSSQPEPSVLGFLLGQKVEQLLARLGLLGKTRPPVLYSCALALRRTAFDSVGGLDEGFDFLDADLDLSWRLRDAGWSQGIEPRLTAVHAGGGSPQSTARRVLRFHRNRFRLLLKHGRIRAPSAVRVALTARHAIELFVLSTGGRLLYSRPLLTDKLAGRRLLLGSVWRGYEDARPVRGRG